MDKLFELLELLTNKGLEEIVALLIIVVFVKLLILQAKEGNKFLLFALGMQIAILIIASFLLILKFLAKVFQSFTNLF